MSDDLISRKALLKELREIMDEPHNTMFLMGIGAAVSIVEHRETAFDKERVIAKIDNASMSRCRYGFINFDLSPRRCIDCQDDFIRAVYEIVEKGGIE